MHSKASLYAFLLLTVHARTVQIEVSPDGADVEPASEDQLSLMEMEGAMPNGKGKMAAAGAALALALGGAEAFQAPASVAHRSSAPRPMTRAHTAMTAAEEASQPWLAEF